MTAHSVPIFAAVTINEQVVVELAGRHLAGALSQATGENWTCPCTFTSEVNQLVGATSGSIIMTSLHLALADLGRPWPKVEQELHDAYKALCETGDPVMICTILRHIDAAADFEWATSIRRRIRKLNLLATELSRQYGALVIDLDRALADVGARRLETDFNLGGTVAAEFASKTMALSIVTNALDTFASEEVQNATRKTLNKYVPSVGLLSEDMMTDVVIIGKGRRSQRVATIIDEVPENHVGWLLRQVLKGRIGAREAFGRLAGAMRRRGARESAWLLISGVSRMFKTAEADRRG